MNITSEDYSKINNEILQLVNQRFTLASGATASFGVIAGFTLTKLFDPTQCWFVCGCSLLAFIVLFLSFLLSHQIKRAIRIYSTYLIVKGDSQWEKDWHLFRKDGFLAFSGSYVVIFITLGCLSFGLPVAFYCLHFTKPFNFSGLVPIMISFIALIIYVVFVFGMGKRSWFIDEESYKARWGKIKI